MQIYIDTHAFTNKPILNMWVTQRNFKFIETYNITQSCFFRSYLELSRAYSCIWKTSKPTI